MTRSCWIEATTLGDLLDRQAASMSSDIVRFPTEKVTFPELAAAADTFARGFHALGVRPGDNVGLILGTSVDFIAAFFGAAKIGAVPVPVNLRFKEVELEHVVRQAELRVVLVASRSVDGPDFGALMAKVYPALERSDPHGLKLPEAPELRHAVLLGEERPGFITRAQFEQAAASLSSDELARLQEAVCVGDPATIMFTSGTTSSPKGAMLSHEALTRQAHASAVTRYALTADDRFWTPMPIFHIGGIIAVLMCIKTGAVLCHPGHYTPDVALDQLERERATVAFAPFEPLWVPVLNHPRFAEADLSSLRIVQFNGAPESVRWAQSRTPWAVCIPGTGMTEAASYISLGLVDDTLEARSNTHGTVMPGIQLRVVDPETGANCPPGVPGHALVRGFARMLGYYNEPELTAEAIDEDGWYRSGDIGVLDAEGHYTWVSRLKDMLKVGGENVAAAEIEGHLSKHPAVAVAQVVGVPDGYYTEVAAAFIELAPGQTVSEQELMRFCHGKIASFKVPRYVRFVDEWPMSGPKIKKYVLQEQLVEELRAAGVITAPKLPELLGDAPEAAEQR